MAFTLLLITFVTYSVDIFMIKKSLQQKFGFNTFRQGQFEVIEALLGGASAAAIFPTGSGKSLCYQLPALHMPHVTIVVSPLLALIQDQIDFMQSKGIPAARIDSSLSYQEEQKTMSDIRLGNIKILMISVERFRNERFRHFLQQVPISMMVVDEAHCISEWGHNFRPDYLKLPDYKEQFNIPQVLLLTATATPKVIEDMSQKFRIATENIVTTGFYRQNLHLAVKSVWEEEKNQSLLDLIKPSPSSPTIVYVTLQKTAQQVSDFLCSEGIKATPYHAGLKNEQRQDIQKQFMSGKTPCIVATIAFGMGIDKADIRRVIHYDLPKSIENYSQEIGRAGRDGEISQCTVLANADNIHVLENFIYGDTPELKNINKLLTLIKNNPNTWEVNLTKLPGVTGIRLLPLKTMLVYLETMGIIRPLYSYFAEYRFALNRTEEEIINMFKGERQQFIANIFKGSKKARKWYSVNFQSLHQDYNAPRDRVTAALEYFQQKELLILEAKQMMDLFQVTNPNFNVDELKEQLYLLFKKKETIEVDRIHHMLKFFESDNCLSASLANYFGEETPWKSCGSCSVCQEGPVTIGHSFSLPPLQGLNFQDMTQDMMDRSKEPPTPNLITRFLCGIMVPDFTKNGLRKLPQFGKLGQYPYKDVLSWVEDKESRKV